MKRGSIFFISDSYFLLEVTKNIIKIYPTRVSRRRNILFTFFFSFR